VANAKRNSVTSVRSRWHILVADLELTSAFRIRVAEALSCSFTTSNNASASEFRGAGLVSFSSVGEQMTHPLVQRRLRTSSQIMSSSHAIPRRVHAHAADNKRKQTQM
jgi:hypothetical protein